MFGPNTVVAELAYKPHAHLYHGKCIFLKTEKGKLTNHGSNFLRRKAELVV